MALIGAIAIVLGVWLPFTNLLSRLLDSQAADLRRWFRTWAIKGLVTPTVLWSVFNLGISEYFPPLVGNIQAASRGWPTVAAFIEVASVGFCIIGTYWSAFTLGWLLRVLEAQAEDRKEFNRVVLGLTIFLGPLAALITYKIGTASAGVAGVIWLAPIVHCAIPMAFRPKKAPSYHRAVVKINNDKYEEAESAVIEELEKSENDFRGWMMLAQLYAQHFDDLAGADRIIRDTCSQETTTVSEVCEGFNALADWHLQLARDPVAARSALSEIGRRYPQTHMARMAQRRMEQLPATHDDYVVQLQPKIIRLQTLGKKFETEPQMPASEMAVREAAALANECVQKLQKNPDNMVEREELARIFAEKLGKAAPALEQIDLLLDMPSATSSQMAEWLALKAAWQIKYLKDPIAGRETMERLVRRFPGTSPGMAADRRIKLMDIEVKARSARANAAPEPKLSIY